MKFVTRTAIAALLTSLLSFSVIAAENNGLAPEVTDLNAADVSYSKEKLIKYLDKLYISTAPTKLDDGIPVGRLGSDGGDTEKILAFAREIAKGPEDTKHSTDSLLISYRGKLIFESYFRRGRINYPHYQMSITKSHAERRTCKNHPGFCQGLIAGYVLGTIDESNCSYLYSPKTSSRKG